MTGRISYRMRLVADQRGLTLVELMVALVISLVLMIGVVTVFQANKTTFRTQEVLAQIQENGRIALALMTRDIRDAGYVGCDTVQPRIRNTLNDPDDYEWAFGTAVDGFNAASASSWSPALDSSISGATHSPLGGTDVLTVRYANGGGARVIQHNSSSAAIKVQAGADIDDDAILLVSDCTNAAVFQATNVTNEGAANTNIEHGDDGSITPGNDTEDLGKKYLGGEVVQLTTHTYFVADTTDGQPALYRMENGKAPQEMLRGIEDLQVTYGVDNDGDRQAEEYATADGVTDWGAVVSVRLSALVRSIQDNVAENNQTYSFNGIDVRATDRRLRQAFSTTVTLRNKAQ